MKLLRIPLLFLALLTLPACSRRQAPSGAAPLSPGLDRYNRGQYAEALPLLEQEAAEAPSGALSYQIAFCRHSLGQDPGDAAELWGEAKTLLEKETDGPGGATVERLYYLTVISDALGDFDAMRGYARRAVDEIEKGPDPNAIGAEDWFRLARLHDFLEEPSEAEAAYRRSVSSFTRDPALNPVYHGLSLAMVADFDFNQGRYENAAAGYDAALKLMPATTQVKPFQHGLALLAVGRFEDAVARFREDRDPQTMTESQYASDLAAKAAQAGPLGQADSDGNTFSTMSLPALDIRIRQAATEYRTAREKYSYRAGDPLSAELKARQKRLMGLLRERLLRTGQLQDFCLGEGMADLVRR